MIGLSWLMSLGFARLTQNYKRMAMFAFSVIGIWLMVRVFVQHPMAHETQNKVLTEEVICP